MALVRIAAAVLIGLILTAAGAVIAPAAWHSMQLRLAADDPAALADLRLKGGVLTAERVAAEIAAALAANDDDLARSLIALADANGLPVSDEQQTHLAKLEADAPQRTARDFAGGFTAGETDSLAGLAGAVTGDVIGYGDLRDLWREGQTLARGGEPDEIVVGLAAVGLAITAGTWASLGIALPARSGVTAVKAARKAGRLSKPLAASLTRMSTDVVDQRSVRQALAAARRLELSEARTLARQAVRPGAVGRLKALSEDAATLYSRTGQRGVMQTLALAENADEVRRAARLAASHGGKTRAILKVLGRGALVLGGILGSLVSWTLAAIAWVFAVMLFARRLGLWLGRRLWPRRSRGVSIAQPSLKRPVPALPLARPTQTGCTSVLCSPTTTSTISPSRSLMVGAA
jgi:hypothetical protein